ncbi:antitoxin [Candidatus Pacearchaeota archaeon]|nr:antitoxin [Candidatus Pacearchaeota archaeon]
MVTKTITITKDAYDALAREKMKDESFSDLAKRLTSKKGTLKDCLGQWKLTDKEKKVFEQIKKSWTQSDKEFKKRVGSK